MPTRSTGRGTAQRRVVVWASVSRLVGERDQVVRATAGGAGEQVSVRARPRALLEYADQAHPAGVGLVPGAPAVCGGAVLAGCGCGIGWPHRKSVGLGKGGT